MKFVRTINLINMSRRQLYKSLIKQGSDLCAIVFAFVISSYMIHFSGQERMIVDIFFLIFSSLIISYFLEIHRLLWRVTSFYNIRDIAKYSLSISLAYIAWSQIFGDQWEVLFKLVFIFTLLSFAFLNLLRVFVRIFYEQRKLLHQEEKKKVIMIGAGKGGELFLRELRKRKEDLYSIEGILDDDPELWGKKIYGFKVYGPIKDLPKLASYGDIDMVAITIPSLDQEKILEITKLAEELNLNVKILPSFSKLLTTTHVYSEDISVESLLGRESINLDNSEVLSFIKDKIVMITGSGGSIGSEICRQLIQFQPQLILIIDHSEYNLYNITWELENTYQYHKFVPIITSVTDKKMMESIFLKYKPQIIFHAAAYKHVPLLEDQVIQAVHNNFFGTKIVAELAADYGCEKFILISTDKAVNPTNVMGTTKRMAEIFCQNLNKLVTTNYVTVRFGNVLESAGSVIPLFKKQLKKGGPLTVTHRDITRFFMSIPEASQLVLEAGAMGQGGEIFVLDMGNPIKISTLAERLITLSGKRPYKDIDIIYTGLRPGEKLYEELFYESEVHTSTKRQKIFLAQNQASNQKEFACHIKNLETYIEENDREKILNVMVEMVPESQLKGASVSSKLGLIVPNK